jgi:uncharacterized damage-inducible protein DinB
LADLRERWPAIWAELNGLVAGMSEEALAGDLHYLNLKGQPFAAPRWQVLLHVVNHASLHRGQVMSMLRQLGHPSPATDLIYFYLQRQTKS